MFVSLGIGAVRSAISLFPHASHRIECLHSTHTHTHPHLHIQSWCGHTREPIDHVFGIFWTIGLCMCSLRSFGQHCAVFCYLCVITIEKESCTNETAEKKRKIIMRFVDLPHTDQIVFETRSDSNALRSTRIRFMLHFNTTKLSNLHTNSLEIYEFLA